VGLSFEVHDESTVTVDEVPLRSRRPMPSDTYYKLVWVEPMDDDTKPYGVGFEIADPNEEVDQINGRAIGIRYGLNRNPRAWSVNHNRRHYIVFGLDRGD
jgi:hypothetical protein